MQRDIDGRWRTRADGGADGYDGGVPPAVDIPEFEWDEVTPEPPPPPPPEPFAPFITEPLPTEIEANTPFVVGPPGVMAEPPIPEVGGDPLAVIGFVWEISTNAGASWTAQSTQTSMTYSTPTPPAVGTLIRFTAFNGQGSPATSQAEVIAGVPQQFAPYFTTALPATTDYHNGWQTVGPIVVVADPPIPTSGSVSGATPGFVWETTNDGITWTPRTGQTTWTYGNPHGSVNIPVTGGFRFRCWNGIGQEAVTTTMFTAGPTGPPRFVNQLPATWPSGVGYSFYPPIGIYSNPPIPLTMTAPTARPPTAGAPAAGFLWETSPTGADPWTIWPNRISRDFAGSAWGGYLRIAAWNGTGGEVYSAVLAV
jgi:hypothetical protein